MNVPALLARRIYKAGSVRKLAAQLGLDHAYLFRVAVGEREPGQQILDALGLERIVTYRKKTVDK